MQIAITALSLNNLLPSKCSNSIPEDSKLENKVIF